MKDKLKAICYILRSKSYFYTVHVGDKYISSFEIGNPPKGGVPAHVRVDVMFTELDNLIEVVKKHVLLMGDRYRNPFSKRNQTLIVRF